MEDGDGAYDGDFTAAAEATTTVPQFVTLLVTAILRCPFLATSTPTPDEAYASGYDYNGYPIGPDAGPPIDYQPQDYAYFNESGGDALINPGSVFKSGRAGGWATTPLPSTAAALLAVGEESAEEGTSGATLPLIISMSVIGAVGLVMVVMLAWSRRRARRGRRAVPVTEDAEAALETMEEEPDMSSQRMGQSQPPTPESAGVPDGDGEASPLPSVHTRPTPSASTTSIPPDMQATPLRPTESAIPLHSRHASAVSLNAA